MSRSRRANGPLNALHTAQRKTQANLTGFLNFIGLAPMSESTGYAATDGGTTLNAMDYTASGDPIDAWIIGIPGGTCGFAGVATVKGGGTKPAPFLRLYRR